MQLFFCFISFLKELAASPLPSNLSAEPPPPPRPAPNPLHWQKVKQSQLEWKPGDSVCRLQPSAVHRESFGQSAKKSWQVISRKTEKVSPLLYLLILSLADSAQNLNLKTIGAATNNRRLMPSALPATLYSLSQILITTQGQSLENTHYIENCDSETLSYCSKVKQLLSGKLDRQSLFHLPSDSALFL